MKLLAVPVSKNCLYFFWPIPRSHAVLLSIPWASAGGASADAHSGMVARAIMAAPAVARVRKPRRSDSVGISNIRSSSLWAVGTVRRVPRGIPPRPIPVFVREVWARPAVDVGRDIQRILPGEGSREVPRHVGLDEGRRGPVAGHTRPDGVGPIPPERGGDPGPVPIGAVTPGAGGLVEPSATRRVRGQGVEGGGDPVA